MVYYVIMIHHEQLKKCPKCGHDKLILTRTREYDVPIIQCEKCVMSFRYMHLPDPEGITLREYEEANPDTDEEVRPLRKTAKTEMEE